MRSYEIDDLGKGLKSAKRPDKLEQGEASDILNWVPEDGFVRLSGGSVMLGETSYSGAVTGVFSALKSDGTKVTWQKVGAKLYALTEGGDWAEVGTDLFENAETEIAKFAEWKGITGLWVFCSSPTLGLIKLSVVNPTSYVSYPDAGFSGDIAIIQNRLWVSGWPTTGGSLDTTGYQTSYQPPATLSSFTAVESESIGTGDASETDFSDTLDFKAAGATRNCFSVAVHPTISNLSLTVTGITQASSAVVTVSESIAGVIPSPGTFEVVLTGQGGMTEINGIPALATYISDHTFSLAIDSTGFSAWSSAGPVWKCGATLTDDGNGGLSSTDGSTGTINYATGAISVSLNAAPPLSGPVPVQYLWEDSYADGLAKFSPLSSSAGDGKAHYLPQPGVGESRGVYPYGQRAYCLHSQGVYEVTFDEYGDPASNLVFRATSGPSSKEGAVATAEGIYYIDDASEEVRLRVIQTVASGNNVYIDNPSVSDDIDFTGFDFSDCSMASGGDLVAFTAKTGTNNNTVFLHDRKLKSFTKLSYPARLLAKYGKQIVYGDVAYGLVGTIDDGTLLSGEPRTNYWTGGDHDLKYDGLQRPRHFWAGGRIGKSQTLVFYADTGSGFVEITRVSGTDTVVDDTSTGLIGDDEVGATEIGLYESEDSYPFEVSKLWNVKLHSVKPKVVAIGVGAASVDYMTFHDIRRCGSRLPEKYRK